MLYRGKYRIPSARWAKWDYSRPAPYFVTVCSRDKECFFGEVVQGEVKLSAIGKIVAEEWLKTPEVRPEVELDEWQVMPNHFHGIIDILGVKAARWAVPRNETPGQTWPQNETLQHNGRENETPHRGVSTSLGAIIGQFKSACTRRIRAAGHHRFAWQPRFFDHVIRDLDELEKIRDYIRHNPLMWDKDKDSIENLYM